MYNKQNNPKSRPFILVSYNTGHMSIHHKRKDIHLSTISVQDHNCCPNMCIEQRAPKWGVSPSCWSQGSLIHEYKDKLCLLSTELAGPK